MNPEQWLSLKWNGGSTMSDRWLNQSKIIHFLRAHPNVLECDCVTGNYSVLLKVAFPSTMELDEFIGKLQHFGKTSTMIVFSTIVQNRGVVPE